MRKVPNVVHSLMQHNSRATGFVCSLNVGELLFVLFPVLLCVHVGCKKSSIPDDQMIHNRYLNGFILL